MTRVGNYCQDWHPDGSPRTVVTIKDGVRSERRYPPSAATPDNQDAPLSPSEASVPQAKP